MEIQFDKSRSLGYIAQIKDSASRFIKSELEREGIKGVIANHSNIFTILHNNDDKVLMSELVIKLIKPKSTVTDMINKLESEGYVVRSEYPDDKRSVYVEFTQKGLDTKPVFDRIIKNTFDKLFNDFTDEDTNQCLGFLLKMMKNFD